MEPPHEYDASKACRECSQFLGDIYSGCNSCNGKFHDRCIRDCPACNESFCDACLTECDTCDDFAGCVKCSAEHRCAAA